MRPRHCSGLHRNQGQHSGTIIGQFHEWPVPYKPVDAGAPDGIFTYVATFSAQGMRPGNPHVTATGTRTSISVRCVRYRCHLQNIGAIIRAGIWWRPTLSVSTWPSAADLQSVTMQISARQTHARSFAYHNQRLTMPADRTSNETFTGKYSPMQIGYLLVEKD